jgi:uncharacterized protein YndB with AHSA1/START domain
MVSFFKKFGMAMQAALGADSPGAALEWVLVTSRNEATGNVILFRVVKHFSSGFNKTEQPVRVILEWPYKGSNGQPVGTEGAAMNAFEDAVDPMLLEDGFATLALVSTGEDLRKWTYYARSEAEFLARLKRALARHPVYPVNIQIAADPGWSRYQEIRSKVAA